MRSQSRRMFFADLVFNVWEDVYEPAEDSFLIAGNLTVQKNDAILDMGCGCGILGIVAAKRQAKVTAIDISPYAVRCSKENAKLNHVAGNMFFLQGDLFEPLRSEAKFDSIVFNAPYLPVGRMKADSWLEFAWAGGATGRGVIDRFIDEAPSHLDTGGCILLVQSNLSSVDETLRRFEQNDLRARIAAERAVPFFETLALVKADR